MYYLRDRTGKSARIAEKIKKKIGIDVETKIHEITEENVMPDNEAKSSEVSKEAAKDTSSEEPKAEVKQEKKEEIPSAEKKENPEVKK